MVFLWKVSSKTQIHAMEKDQLAQLLEEKNSLQKVQEDRIRNLTEMLVTSASFSSKENTKVSTCSRFYLTLKYFEKGNIKYIVVLTMKNKFDIQFLHNFPYF